MTRLAKPAAFYDTFDRRGPGERTTHYCPGCGHGTVHKLIAEAIDDFGVQDRVIFCSPVGCSVFAYYYFDTGNIQCSHGRAPAAATGLRRSLDDAIVISYQGDGDVAGIGTAEIIHAANRGENFTAIFINNAIYGMTGGQMAPTTILGQKTMTTPFGRSAESEGNPIRMAELISTLAAPVYVERVSLGDGQRVLRARKAIRKAIRNQIERRGFSFVEVLSPCPVNWKMTPTEARVWIKEDLEPVFPLGTFRDVDAAPISPPRRSPIGDEELERILLERLGITAETEPVAETPSRRGRTADGARHEEAAKGEQNIKIAGFGGQGVLSAGVLLANCGTIEDRHATWLPSYGPEMRGGTANASVILSEHVIGSPLVDHPNLLIAMNGPSLESFEGDVETGGTIVVNSSIVSKRAARSDVRLYAVPASDIARDAGVMPAASVVMVVIGALLTGFPSVDTIRKALPHSLKRRDLVEPNLRVVDAAVVYFAGHPEGGYPQ